mmetsp:Transcript_131811/g.409775  ORF Transcript_131811/g.409775 Transcript_131811/m.409775 type:complete len:235 (-) Transcript_131811:1461-2165(-)
MQVVLDHLRLPHAGWLPDHVEADIRVGDPRHASVRVLQIAGADHRDLDRRELPALQQRRDDRDREGAADEALVARALPGRLLHQPNLRALALPLPRHDLHAGGVDGAVAGRGLAELRGVAKLVVRIRDLNRCLARIGVDDCAWHLRRPHGRGELASAGPEGRAQLAVGLATVEVGEELAHVSEPVLPLRRDRKHVVLRPGRNAAHLRGQLRDHAGPRSREVAERVVEDAGHRKP